MDRLNFLRLLCIGTFIWLLFSVFTSCAPETRSQKAPQSKRLVLDSTSSYSDQNYRTYTLEGCEYIVIGVGKDRWGSHKGNCKNPIHNKECEIVETEVDTTIYQEKNFDCYVQECEYEVDSKLCLITTECGIQFYDKKCKKEGTILKNFKSPKHK